VYVQIRDVVASFVGQDPSSIASSVFGIPSGTLELTRSLAMELVKWVDWARDLVGRLGS
jgi:hypothetical protein